MSAAQGTAKAKKGDLALVEHKHVDYIIGEGSREHTSYEFGIVASTTREGVVKTWQSLGYGNELVSQYAQPIRHDRCMVASKSSLDVEATLLAAKAHHWPGHPTQPMPFDSIEAAKAAVIR